MTRHRPSRSRLTMPTHPAQIEGEREVRMYPCRLGGCGPWRMAHGLEQGAAASLGFQRVHGRRREVAAARMRRMVSAATDRTAVPRIDDIERQRHVRPDGRV